MKTSHYSIVLVLAALAFRIPGMITLPIIDPSEGRYAASALQMLHDGDWLTPKIYMQSEAVPYLGKPPLEFWLASLSMHWGNIHPFWLRLPNLLSVVLVLCMVYLVLRRYDGPEIAALSVVFCAAAPALLALAGIALPDVLLMSSVTAAASASYAFLRETDLRLRKRWSLAIFFFAAIGFMIKGPVALLYLVLPAFVWTLRWRRWDAVRQHAWVSGTLLFLLLAAPWFAASEVAHPGFLHYFFIQENLMRFLSKDYGDLYGTGHPQHFGMSFVYTLLLAFPWTFVAIFHLSTRAGRSAARTMPNAAERTYLLYCLASTTVFWCLSRNYLSTYLLPAIPAGCIWFAMLVAARGGARKAVLGLAIPCVVVTVAALALIPHVDPAISTLEAGDKALEIVPKSNEPKRFAWVRKVPNSAFFYFRENVIGPPEAEELDALLPWFAKNQDEVFISDAKYLRKLPESFHARLNIHGYAGKWTIFTINPSGS